VNAILAIPLPLRLAALVVLGAVAGGFVNWATYSLAWNRRAISPWSAPPPRVTPRGWLDRLPIVGWWLLAREWPVHGRGFWLRPLLVEFVTGGLLAVLYLLEVEWHPRVAIGINAAAPPADFLSSNLPLAAHVRYLSHALLVVLMLAASLVDIDEKTIPDSITVSGAVAGLLLAALYPWSLLPADTWLVDNVPAIEFLSLVSPRAWLEAVGGLPPAVPVWIGLGCWTLWCGGLLPRRWNTRHGWMTAVRVFIHRLRVDAMTYRIAAMGLAGAAAILAAAWWLPRAHWAGLLTALVGLAGGGGLVWVVRVVGGASLKREAMGFGDVTLMSMIGAFLGWQTALVIFFLAPFAALVVGVTQRVVHGEREIPYGPFLCLAALGVILKWPALWPWVAPIFALSWLVPAVLAVCMGLMGLMLLGYRLVLEWFVTNR
jgi:prepilin signal peptidase PulO-like enzyme (type II secretory pathway)